ncbi:MAG: hypothetical protein ACOYLH_00760 [Flavobacteriales bacterium]
MTQIARYTASIAMLCLAIVLFACQRKPDYSREVSMLDSLRVQMLSSFDSTAVLKSTECEAWQDSASAKILFIQNEYKALMPSAMALQISDYQQAMFRFNEPEKTFNQLTEAYRLEKKQIEDLIATLKSNATHDALGNEITPIYVQEALKAEQKASQDWINNWVNAKAALNQTESAHQRMETDIKAIVDSLKKTIE